MAAYWPDKKTYELDKKIWITVNYYMSRGQAGFDKHGDFIQFSDPSLLYITGWLDGSEVSYFQGAPPSANINKLIDYDRCIDCGQYRDFSSIVRLPLCDGCCNFLFSHHTKGVWADVDEVNQDYFEIDPDFFTGCSESDHSEEPRMDETSEVSLFATDTIYNTS